jgi:hypothetical protein
MEFDSCLKMGGDDADDMVFMLVLLVSVLVGSLL